MAVPTQSIFYDPWGLSMKGMQITRNASNYNKYQFLNRETQVETGYIDLIHRQYDPSIAKFTSQDSRCSRCSVGHLELLIYRISNPNTETNNWYKSVSYYDYKGCVIQSFSQNHLAEIDRTDFQYRFNNEVLKTIVAHFKRNTHYMQGEKGVLKKLGEQGGKININEIYKN